MSRYSDFSVINESWANGLARKIGPGTNRIGSKAAEFVPFLDIGAVSHLPGNEYEGL